MKLKNTVRIISLLILLCGSFVVAQVSAGGTPPSLTYALDRSTVPVEVLPAIDVEPLLAEDAAAPKDEPPRFGYSFAVSYNLENSGYWQQLPDGGRLWRLALNAPGAIAINLIYNRYHLPEGGQLFLYNEDYYYVLGAFTDFNNKEHGEFATAPVPGETITLEYYEPAGATGSEIAISNVIHDYRDIFGFGDRNYGDSGSCNNNVNCPVGDPWANEIRGAAMVLLAGGTRWCSGSLINNVRQDLTQYFLTANHCLTSNVNTWIILFNYQSPGCTNQNGSVSDYVQGTTLRATNSASDFALLELTETIPEDYNVFFSGWSALDTPPQEPVCIHHPSGDIKKITFDYDAGISDGWNFNDGSHWRIAEWDDGTTEPGSSGSPLFDNNHRIVGQLHGGQASCSYNFNDYYGKFAWSWDHGNNASNRLKDWLDPDDTGILTLDGIDSIPIEYTLGDVNSDNDINVLDVVLIVNFILNLQEPDPVQTLAADLNEDGIINVLDVISLINMIVNTQR